MINSFTSGSTIKQQDRWWYSSGLYFSVAARFALFLKGITIPLGDATLPSDFSAELYYRDGLLKDDWGADGWEAMKDAKFSFSANTLDVRFELPMVAQTPVTFYIFIPHEAVIPSYVPNWHTPFTGAHINDLFSEGPGFRVFVGRWGGENRFEIYCQDRRGFRGNLLFTRRVI